MPLPKGFKVDGSVPAVQGAQLVPPRVRKIIVLLNTLPVGKLLSSAELGQRVNLSFGGAWTNHPVVMDYRQKVDGKLFWGSRKSIAKLRKQLEDIEDSNGHS